MSMGGREDVSQLMPEHIAIDGVSFSFVKGQRDGKSAVYKGPDSYLRIGDTEKINADRERHERMEGAGFPVARILAEGTLDGRSYFIESSVGEKTVATAFAEDTEAAGSIRNESFKQFLDVMEQFARAQLRTQVSEKDFKEFAEGIHLDILLEELPEHADKIKERFMQLRERTSSLPFVITHGDFNPYNLYPGGAIDLEDSYHAPFGYDVVGALVSIDYFPDSQEFEYFARYRFSEAQRKEYFARLDAVCDEHRVPRISDFVSDFTFARAVWLLVRMHKWPKIQKFRYEKFIKDFLGD